MTSIESIVQQLKAERDRISEAIAALESVAGSNGGSTSTGKRIVSAASREKMRRAQRARWARVKGQSAKTESSKLTLVKRTMSAAARRKIAAAQRARWAKVKKAA